MMNEIEKTEAAATRMKEVHALICETARKFGPCKEIESALMEVSEAARMLSGMVSRMEESANSSDDHE